MNNPDPVLVQHYAVLKGISHKEAREKLKENYELEVSQINFRDLTLRCMHGLRQISPKVSGLESREQDTQFRVGKIEDEVKRINDKLKDVVLLKKDIYLIGEVVKEKQKLIGRLLSLIEKMDSQIEELKKPWYRKLFKK